MKAINQRLKHICYLKGLTHRKVAKDLNINSQQFNNWCNNTKPTIEGLEKLVNYFPDLNVRWLISGVGEPLLLETIKLDSQNTINLNSDHKQYDVDSALTELEGYIKKLKKNQKEHEVKSSRFSA